MVRNPSRRPLLAAAAGTALTLAALAAAGPPPALAAPTGDGDPGAETAAQGTADARAAEVAARALEALGGAEAWASTRVIRFGFAGRRSHLWDRAGGRHRVEGTTEDGTPYVVIHDLAARTGRAWVGGEEVEGDRLAEMLDDAWGAWVNDTYWLVMPYKLRDPGGKLAWDGEETIDGTVYDRLALSFEGVGLTPGDRYWAWFSRDTGLMDRWAYVLQHQPEDSDPTIWLWQGWTRYGGIMLAPIRRHVDGERSLDLSPIEVVDSVPEALFEGP
jgi:hypothetical protein